MSASRSAAAVAASGVAVVEVTTTLPLAMEWIVTSSPVTFAAAADAPTCGYTPISTPSRTVSQPFHSSVVQAGTHVHMR